MSDQGRPGELVLSEYATVYYVAGKACSLCFEKAVAIEWYDGEYLHQFCLSCLTKIVRFLRRQSGASA